MILRITAEPWELLLAAAGIGFYVWMVRTRGHR